MGKRCRRSVEQLTLFVRHRAWLDAAPGKGEHRKSRAETFLADEDADKPRTELAMPPIDEATEPFFYLVEHLFRVGPATAGETLSYEEIQAWAGLNTYDLSGWEAETLRSLSSAYLSEHHAAQDHKRTPPYTPAAPVIDRSEIARRIMAAFQQLAAPEEVSPQASEAPPSPRKAARGTRGPASSSPQ